MARRLVLLLISVVVVTLTAVCAGAVGKITVDPNSGAANAKEPENTDAVQDARLAQSVSYTAKQKRLYQVAGDLTKMTGVTVRAGRNKTDWHVRDIPVTICVKDMPLGKLLSTMADTTHLVLSSENIAEIRSYRLIRSSKLARELAAFREARDSRDKAMFDADWQAAAQFGASEKPAGSPDDVKAGLAQSFAKLIAAVGDSGREKLRNGEPVVLTQGGSTSGAVNSVVSATWRVCEKDKWSFSGSFGNGTPTQDDLAEAEVVLYPVKWSDRTRVQAKVNIPLHGADGNRSFSSLHLSMQQHIIDQAHLDTGTKPPEPEAPRDDDMERKYKPVPLNGSALALLDTKAKLDAPKDAPKETLSMTDMLVALAEATGWALVAEDFESQKIHYGLDGCFGHETSVRDDLKQYRYDVDWFADEQDKLLVGVAHEWWNHHEALAPESLISGLKEKLEGDGVTLDDATPLAALTDEQFQDWVSYTRDLTALNPVSFSTAKPLWAIYDSLSAEDKLLAKSRSGIPLAKLDLSQVVSAMSQCNGRAAKDSQDPKTRLQFELPADARVAQDLSMRITSEEVWTSMTIETNQAGGFSMGTGVATISANDTKPPQAGMLRKTKYSLEVFGKSDGRLYMVYLSGPAGFPFYSLKWGTGEHGSKAVPVK